MRRAMKQLTWVFFSLVAMFVAVLTVHAANTNDDWQYKVSVGEATITGYLGSSKDIVIPSAIDGYPVTGIGNNCFKGSNIETLTIPESIEKLGSNAFRDCKYLKKINFNAKNCSDCGAGYHCFVNAGKFSGSLDVIFGAGVQRIPAYLFYNYYASNDANQYVTSVTIPASVQSIGNFAFYKCESLKTVSWGNGIRVFGKGSFYGCVSLQSVTIPAVTESLGSNAFRDCKYLKKIDFNAINCSDCGAGDHCFVNAGKFSGSLEVVFGQGVQRIPEYLFYNYYANNDSNQYVTSVAIPDSVHSIGEFAFKKSSSIKTITIKSRSATLENGAFSDLSKSTIFKCYRNSTTATYALENGYRISYLDSTISLFQCSVELNYTTKTYSGKALKPTVTVTYGSKKLTKGMHYTVSYKNNKNVGVASVIITGKGYYTEKLTKTFQILPKGTSISSLKAGSKRFTVTLKKQATQTNGYVIQYATNSKFSNAKTVVVSSNSKTKVTVKKLKAKKKYYVRVRTYKTVSGKKYYSGWSKSKTVRTKE